MLACIIAIALESLSLSLSLQMESNDPLILAIQRFFSSTWYNRVLEVGLKGDLKDISILQDRNTFVPFSKGNESISNNRSNLALNFY